MAASPTKIVATSSSRETTKTNNTASEAFGISKTIATAVTRQQQAAVRTAPASRPGRGASSSAKKLPSDRPAPAGALATATAGHQDVGRLAEARHAL